MKEKFLKIKNKLRDQKGFTVLELIFVIIIFAILSTTCLISFRTFSARISFNNLTQDIALSVVQAQKDAMMGAINSNFISRDIKPAYGIYFTTASSTSGTHNVVNTQFVSFTDMPGVGSGSTSLIGDKIYDPTLLNINCGNSSNPECVRVAGISTGEYVSKICYVSGSLVCASPDVSIVFVRPNPDPVISVRTSFAVSTYITTPAVCIEVAAPQDVSSTRTIKINSFGQISTFNTPSTSTLCS